MLTIDPPPAVRIIAGNGVLAREEHGVHVDVHDARPVLLGFLDDGALAADAHVVVEAVETAPAGHGVLDHGGALRGTR